MSGFPATIQTNLTAAARAGLTLDADADPGDEGLFEELIASANALSEGGVLLVRTLSTSGADTGALVDLAVGAAASESVIYPNYNAGAASTSAQEGKALYFPQRIAASARVSARMEAVVVSETAEVAVWLFQSIHHMENVGTAVAYGADEDAGDACGVSVTPASGSFGTWTEIGTTSEDHNLFQVGVDPLGQTNLQTRDLLVEIGHGPNSGAVTTIGGSLRVQSGSFENISSPIPNVPMYAVVASGTKVWARVASGDTNACGVIIHGMSGTEVSASASLLPPAIGVGPAITIGR